MLNWISVLAIPVILFLILCYGLYSGVKVYDCFMEGGAEGIKTLVKILPALVGLITAISMFRASGALELLVYMISPVTNFLGIPSEVIPLGLMRPISGSGALGIVADIFKNHGTDSFIGRAASVMMGSTETTFYTLAIYFGSIGVTHHRHTIRSALCADITGIISSVFVCRLLFGL